MSRKKEMNRGFTYLEVIAALTIMIIISGFITSFFVFHMKIFNRSVNVAEIQYQGQIGMSELSEHIMKARKIIKIQNSALDVLEYDYKTPVTNVVFQLNSGRYLILKHTTNTAGIKVLRMNTNGRWAFSPANAEFIDYIDSLELEPVSNTFQSCNAIILTMTFKKGEERITISSQVNFRNAEK